MAADAHGIVGSFISLPHCLPVILGTLRPLRAGLLRLRLRGAPVRLARLGDALLHFPVDHLPDLLTELFRVFGRLDRDGARPEQAEMAAERLERALLVVQDDARGEAVGALHHRDL